jgi:hypothetical protein
MSLNHQKLNEINRRLNLVDVCLTGFWFCKGCARITELEEGNGMNRCAICGGVRLDHHPALFTREEHERITEERQKEEGRRRKFVSREGSEGSEVRR